MLDQALILQLLGESKFDPPFESPIEEAFVWELAKHLAPDVRFEKQVELTTRFGRFRVDFVAFCGSLSVGFECDGADFHDSFRDECRDAIILGEACLDAIYRIRGKDIQHHLHDCLFVIANWDPQLVSDRGHVNLDRLASEAAKRRVEPAATSDTVFISYPETAFSVRLERRARAVPQDEQRHWQFLHQYAVSKNVANVDQLVEMRRRDFRTRG